MTSIKIELSKVEDMTITFDEKTSQLIISSKSNTFPEVKGLVVPAGTDIAGLRKIAIFLANIANFVILQIKLQS